MENSTEIDFPFQNVKVSFFMELPLFLLILTDLVCLQ